jgi:hypothetical protein
VNFVKGVALIEKQKDCPEHREGVSFCRRFSGSGDFYSTVCQAEIHDLSKILDVFSSGYGRAICRRLQVKFLAHYKGMINMPDMP